MPHTAQSLQNVQNTLDFLIELNLDSQHGFKIAAYAVEDASLRADLVAQSRQHAQFVQDLKDLASTLGLAPYRTQSRSIPPLMRGWLTLKHAVATHDRYAILAECEISLAKAVECYRHALAAGLPHWLSDHITMQALKTEHNHDRFSQMSAMALALLPATPPRRPVTAAFSTPRREPWTAALAAC